MVKKITLESLQQILEKVINSEISREEAANWAFEHQTAFDQNNLVFDPPENENQIWEALDFLCGIDLEAAPENYLHGMNEIIDYKNKLITL